MKTRKYWKGGYAVYPDPPNKRKKSHKVRRAFKLIGGKVKKGAYIVAREEAKALRQEGGFANLQGRSRLRSKKSGTKVIYVYPSGKRKIVYKNIKHIKHNKHKKVKKRQSRPDFNPFKIDF